MKSLKLELFVVFVSPISVSDPKPLKFDLKIQLFLILTQNKIMLKSICPLKKLQCGIGGKKTAGCPLIEPVYLVFLLKQLILCGQADHIGYCGLVWMIGMIFSY